MGELTVEEQPKEVKDVQVATKLIRDDDEPVLVEATGLDAVVAEAVEADVAAHALTHIVSSFLHTFVDIAIAVTMATAVVRIWCFVLVRFMFALSDRKDGCYRSSTIR